MKLTNGLHEAAWSLPSDLSSSQTHLLLEKSPPPGAKLRKYTVEAVLDAILYLIKTGCRWRMPPPHFPEWRTVYNHFRSWADRGWFQTTLLMLVMKRREDTGRDGMPTAGIIDSQSIRQVSPQSEKGVDGYKRVKGIKRHIVTDSQGYPLTVLVTTANVSDAKGVYPVVFNAMEKIPSIRHRSLKNIYARVADVPQIQSCRLNQAFFCFEITTARRLAGKFRQDFIGLDARIKTSSTCEISSTIRRPSDAKI